MALYSSNGTNVPGVANPNRRRSRPMYSSKRLWAQQGSRYTSGYVRYSADGTELQFIRTSLA